MPLQLGFTGRETYSSLATEIVLEITCDAEPLSVNSRAYL